MAVKRECVSDLGVTVVETGDVRFYRCELEAEHHGTPHRVHVGGELREWTTPELPVGWPRDTLPEPDLELEGEL